MFLTQLELIALPQPDEWKLGTDLVWQDYEYGKLVVPAGFQTDLASTPYHIGDDGLSRRPGAMHDWLYGSREGRMFGKTFADRFLRDSLRAEGASFRLAWTFYLGVHWFGLNSWESDGERLLRLDSQ